MTRIRTNAVASVAIGVTAMALGLAAPASAYTVTRTLDGDPRGNPTGLSVIVTVDVGESASGCAGLGNQCSFWTIELDMAGEHDQAKLHEFYFNVGQVGEESKFTGATFDNFMPGAWTVITPASEQGSGNWGADGFLFEASDGTGVTNDISLSFNMILSAGNSFDVAGPSNDFVGDNLKLSSTTAFSGEWQMGAHLGGIGANGEDSGFAVGNYNGDPPDDPPGIAEPGTLALFSLGLLGLGLARRRRVI